MSLENIILFLDKTGNSSVANEVLDIFAKNAGSFEQFDEVANCYFKIKNYEKAINNAEKALVIASTPQQMYVIRHNLINLYNHNNQPEKALRYIRANENVIDVDNDRDFEKAFSLFLSNRKSEASTLLRQKLGDTSLNDEQRIKLEFNLGTYDLIEGNFKKGMNRFLVSGEEMGVHSIKTFMTQIDDSYGLKKWYGESIKKLLVIAEAGIGDEVINVRFMKHLKDKHIEAYWLGLKNRKDLIELFKLNDINAISSIKELPVDFLKDAYYIPSMQLPIALDLDESQLWDGPYLHIENVSDVYKAKWKNYFDMKPHKLNVGIRWQGNPEYDQDLHRSIPLENIIKVLPAEINCCSLQRDTGLDQLAEFSFLDEIDDLSNRLDTFFDLVECISHLDVIVTSCTSIAHFAGAMGKHVCVVVPISCYYVWCQPGNKSNWYGDNVKIFYQQKPRSWDEPLNELQQHLLELQKHYE